MHETPLTRLLGTRLPIVQGGMAWVSRHRLAAAVSEAGGLGVLGAATMEPEELRREIALVRARTQRPFAVNVPLVCVRPDGTPIAEQLVEVAIAERVPVVITGAGSPARFTERLRKGGATVLHVVPSPALAAKAEAAGVHAVVAESCEAAGHIRDGGLATFSLVPQVVDAVACPVVAAGGIADARGILAAFALGAHGGPRGPRFVATAGCEAHAGYTRALVDAGAEGAVVYSRADRASRGLATPLVAELVEMERAGADAAAVAARRGRHRARAGCVDGDLQTGICPAGSAVGLVRETPTVAELVQRIVAELAAELERLEQVLGGERLAG